MSARDRLNQIQARANAATRPPWIIDALESGEHGLFVDRDPQFEALGCGSQQVAGFMTEANAAFVAAARSDVPALTTALHAVLDLCDNWPERIAARPGHVHTPPNLIRDAIESALGGDQ